MKKKDKKPFKDTKFGQLLTSKIPSAIGLVGNLVPDGGVLGVVKNVISGAVSRGEITPEEAAELNAEADREFEYYLTDQKDRESARLREMEMAKAGRSDWLFNLSGLIALLGGIVVVVVALFFPLEGQAQERLFYFVAGAAFNWVTQVMSYFFGSSKGSKEKTDKLNNVLKK